MQTLRKKTSPCKYRNDPGRFFGDGVTFKAKLIGILEVGEARGDRMCQEALQDLKIAIRAAGEHKQRITIHVTIDGLRLRDEKTGDSLYHHPVHKISFIAQDMTDSRAFGYIFGSPDSGHRFFGIKTDKAASQVVLAMRDLFQVVFELKKKEIELARQHLQSKTIHEHQPIMLTVKSTNPANLDTTPNKTMNEPSCSKVLHKAQTSPESVADLVDLEQELSSIQRGITQMERITPNEAPKSVLDNGDPFGDSFSSFPNLLPPPESSSSRSRHSKPLKPPEDATIEERIPTNVAPQACAISSEDWLTTSEPISPLPSYEDIKPPIEEVPTKPIEDLNSTVSSTNSTTSTSSSSTTTSAKYIDAFTELDPLGTGKIKPYVDKKFFFQDLKNPPKKVLKDLSNQSGHDSVFTTNFSSSGYKADDSKLDNNDIQNLESQMFGSSDISSTNTENNDIKGNDSSIPANALFPQPDLFQNTSNDIFKAKFHNSGDNGYKSNSNKKLEDLCDDPFSSSSNKKIDPFMEDSDFSKIIIDPFDFEFNDAEYSIKTSDPIVFPDTKITSDYPLKLQSGCTKQELKKSIDGNVFNGPLQVNLPPESWATTNSKRCERQNSESSSPNSSIRNRPSVFKQNTVDVISSISTKKMKPYMFSQKFSKKDSNSINMRRLQESDSLSENEAAPEPPPRPDSGSHVEPPPLPPKKQFSDIIIRPSTRSTVTLSSTDRDSRYAYISSKLKSQSNDNAPPLPLPSRKIGRPETSFSIAARQARKCEEDDYLTPIPPRYDVPILLPPPQAKAGSKCRVFRKHESHESKMDNIYESIKPLSDMASNDGEILPNITLTQLLTLGIDDLAERLNVPTVKLSIMTLVELTSYLSEFIENNKKAKAMEHHAHPCSKATDQSSLGYSVFKVSFDEENDATFVAKFDDNFGEDSSFVANFDNFEAKAETTVSSSSDTTTDSNVDKYAVFRELLETGNQIEVSDSETHNVDESITIASNDKISINDNIERANELVSKTSPIPVPITKINTKITETIANAKDRYAALRDIILVEDLFEKPGSISKHSDEDKNEKPIINIGMDSAEPEMIIDTPTNTNKNSSPEINISDEMSENCTELKTSNETADLFNNLQINKDDVEIDEYMNRAISNLSLDSRDHLSPIVSKSPVVQSQNASTSPIRLQNNKSPNIIRSPNEIISKATLNDMSTSPIPIQKSPLTLSLNQRRSPLAKSPEIISKTSTPQPQNVALLLETNKSANSGSLSDIVCGSSPENENNLENSEQKSVPVVSESWAVFDQQPETVKDVSSNVRSSKDNKNDMESPCSSEGKNEWKNDPEYNRKWPKGQTSSSSRDVSPWDEDTQEYRRRPYGAEKNHHVRHTRRMNSCEDDFEYEEENMKRHDRRIKGHVYRNRDYYQEGPSWSKANDSNSWSPTEDDEEKVEHARAFDRRAYERSTYGPPYDKREHKSLPLYERRDYKNFDKRKFYRDEYAHPDYDFDMYAKSPESKERKAIYFEEGNGGGVYESRPREYDEMFSGSFERSSRDPKGSSAKSAREYYYERSFDRESMDSYESGGGPGRRSFGSGEIYGSLESRGDYRDDKRYMPPEKSRSLRKLRPLDNYEQDSESETMARRGPGDTRSLQRPPQSTRPRKTSASSPWDGEDVTPTSGPKSWKRPSSASESDRRIVDNRKILINPVSGSDGEKDRSFRFRKKTRNRGSKETDYRSNYATLRSTIQRREDDYLEMEEPGSTIPRNLSHFPESDVCNKRLYENEYYRKQRQQFYKSTTPRSEGRTMSDSLRAQDLPKRPMKFSYDSESERLDCMKNYKKGNMSAGSREMYYDEKEKPRFNFDDSKPISLYKRPDVSEFDEFEKMHKPPLAIPKNMSQLAYEEEQGFESDFNSPSNTKVFRFSNDFSDKDSPKTVQQTMAAKHDIKNSNYNFSNNNEYSTTSSAKLRFDDNIKVNKFESEKHMFEDDFSKTEFDFENEDKWNDDLPTQAPTMKNVMHRLPKTHDHIKKSESVNIFAKKSEDPFEDDDFFKQPDDDENNDSNGGGGNNSHNGKNIQKADPFEWQKNFANFDQNI